MRRDGAGRRGQGDKGTQPGRRGVRFSHFRGWAAYTGAERTPLGCVATDARGCVHVSVKAHALQGLSPDAPVLLLSCLLPHGWRLGAPGGRVPCFYGRGHPLVHTGLPPGAAATQTCHVHTEMAPFAVSQGHTSSCTPKALGGVSIVLPLSPRGSFFRGFSSCRAQRPFLSSPGAARAPLSAQARRLPAETSAAGPGPNAHSCAPAGAPVPAPVTAPSPAPRHLGDERFCPVVHLVGIFRGNIFIFVIGRWPRG